MARAVRDPSDGPSMADWLAGVACGGAAKCVGSNGGRTPVDGLDKASGRWQEVSSLRSGTSTDVPASEGYFSEGRLRGLSTTLPPQGLQVGTTLRALAPTSLHELEAPESAVIRQFAPETQFVIRRFGPGGRVQVRAETTEEVGWVNLDAEDGGPVLEAFCEAPGEAFTAGAVARVRDRKVLMREGARLDSREICDCMKDETVKILERSDGRRLKVLRLLTKEVGWVSATGPQSAKFLSLVEEAPARVAAFAAGASVWAVRDVLMREDAALESGLVGEWKAGEELVVEERAQNMRWRVRHVATGTSGWVSSASRLGDPLLEAADAGVARGAQLEAMAEIAVRVDKDLRSQSLGDCPRGGLLVVLDCCGRRIKVAATTVDGTPVRGWVSTRTSGGKRLVQPLGGLPDAPACMAPLRAMPPPGVGDAPMMPDTEDGPAAPMKVRTRDRVASAATSAASFMAKKVLSKRDGAKEGGIPPDAA